MSFRPTTSKKHVSLGIFYINMAYTWKILWTFLLKTNMHKIYDPHCTEAHTIYTVSLGNFNKLFGEYQRDIPGSDRVPRLEKL